MNLEGKPIRARSLRVGDEIINDWTGEHLVVVNIEHGMRYARDDRPRHVIEVHCVKGEHNKPDTLYGNYYKSHVRLVRRGVKLSSPLDEAKQTEGDHANQP